MLIPLKQKKYQVFDVRTKYAATGVKAYKLIATGMLFNEVAPSVPDTPKGNTEEGSIWKLLGG